MFYEWILIFLLIITALLLYIASLIRKFLLKAGLTSSAAVSMPAVIVPDSPGAHIPQITNIYEQGADGNMHIVDEEIAAVVIAAISAYEHDKA